eukprot:scaffold13806_cov80-Skeletonema_dohrnii-CCMP3373.AAC.5
MDVRTRENGRTTKSTAGGSKSALTEACNMNERSKTIRQMEMELTTLKMVVCILECGAPAKGMARE